MDLYRAATPVYQGTHPQPQATTGLLPGLLCNLFGGGTPAYQTLAGSAAPAAPASRCWWQPFAVTPSYKTAPPAAIDSPDALASSPPGADVGDGLGYGYADTVPQVVIL